MEQSFRQQVVQTDAGEPQLQPVVPPVVFEPVHSHQVLPVFPVEMAIGQYHEIFRTDLAFERLVHHGFSANIA
jgi:hypothetical protein